jgi:hypothetical protein
VDGFTPPGKAAESTEQAGVLLAAYEALTGSGVLVDTNEEGTSESEALVDLLTDLRHWCDTHRVDFDRALDSSHMHWSGEQEDDDDDEVDDLPQNKHDPGNTAR